VRKGGGVVVYHAADNSFPNWPEYNEIIGLGWGRAETKDPYVYIRDGEVVRDLSPGRCGSHGYIHEFVVQAYKPDNPILRGLPEKWLHAQDELYSELRGPAKNMEILAYAHAGEKYLGTGRNEPVLMTVTYEKGRIFHTVLGHAGSELFPPAMECAGFVTTLQRGAEWAATGRVTGKVPAAFPTENEALLWEFYEDIHSDITPVVKRMERYDTGKSNDCFNILKKLIAVNIGNQGKMDEYHRIIQELLKSRKSTVECKKVLLKEFSWIANDSYRDIYEQMKQKPKLAEEAQYALDMIGN
jgi:type 1 glutamine amidotransferase